MLMHVMRPAGEEFFLAYGEAFWKEMSLDDKNSELHPYLPHMLDAPRASDDESEDVGTHHTHTHTHTCAHTHTHTHTHTRTHNMHNVFSHLNFPKLLSSVQPRSTSDTPANMK